MTFTRVSYKYGIKCKNCASPNIEYAEHDENCDVCYRCGNCHHSWWVDGSDY